MTGTKCRGVCDRYDNSIKSYLDGQLIKCTTCDIFLICVYERCFCCNSQLRAKPKSPKDKKTEKGNEAFYKHKTLMIRAKNEYRLLSKIPGERTKILTSIHDYLKQALTQYIILEHEHRQRPAYLEAKRKSMFDFLEKIRKV